MLDYNGTYESERVIYTDEYGFCLLTAFYPEHRMGELKGSAVTHIPFVVLLSEEFFAHNRHEDDDEDSRQMLSVYKFLASYDDFVIDIGNHGKYFARKYVNTDF